MPHPRRALVYFTVCGYLARVCGVKEFSCRTLVQRRRLSMSIPAKIGKDRTRVLLDPQLGTSCDLLKIQENAKKMY
ncbi:hypothetical protein GYMLUDRAFT_40045 [Collybiopsis luxurians FD-317 M1]|nr:hypothetical protein GYMLUDRAFT_40045 [Collybiopsis luxurians FD-317 M1]